MGRKLTTRLPTLFPCGVDLDGCCVYHNVYLWAAAVNYYRGLLAQRCCVGPFGQSLYHEMLPILILFDHTRVKSNSEEGRSTINKMVLSPKG